MFHLLVLFITTLVSIISLFSVLSVVVSFRHLRKPAFRIYMSMHQGIVDERARGACIQAREGSIKMGIDSGIMVANGQCIKRDGHCHVSGTWLGWDGLVESLVDAYVIRFCEASNQSIPGAPPF